MKIIFIIFKDNKYYIEYNAFDIELFFHLLAMILLMILLFLDYLVSLIKRGLKLPGI